MKNSQNKRIAESNIYFFAYIPNFFNSFLSLLEPTSYFRQSWPLKIFCQDRISLKLMAFLAKLFFALGLFLFSGALNLSHLRLRPLYLSSISAVNTNIELLHLKMFNISIRVTVAPS